MLLVIDNYDSFVFNLVRYCEELGETVKAVRNDRIDLSGIEAMAPDAILISPGPCSPAQAGISLTAVRNFSGRIPMLGVCLGHQCIGAAFGAEVVRAKVPMHGRASRISHDGQGLFAGLPQPLSVGRYHSLIVAPPDLPGPLTFNAFSPEGEVMALAHTSHPTYGVQFHPESILSDHGHDLLANFFAMARAWRNPERDIP
jgi:para-aminobenzoate synthetase component 2